MYRNDLKYCNVLVLLMKIVYDLNYLYDKSIHNSILNIKTLQDYLENPNQPCCNEKKGFLVLCALDLRNSPKLSLEKPQLCK